MYVHGDNMCIGMFEPASTTTLIRSLNTVHVYNWQNRHKVSVFMLGPYLDLKWISMCVICLWCWFTVIDAGGTCCQVFIPDNGSSNEPFAQMAVKIGHGRKRFRGQWWEAPVYTTWTQAKVPMISVLMFLAFFIQCKCTHWYGLYKYTCSSHNHIL